MAFPERRCTADSLAGFSGAGSPEPFHGGDLLAGNGLTAKIRQDRTGAPSSNTVQAPHTPCSQPTWVPVNPRSCRRKSDSVRRATTRADRWAPFTV